MLDVTTRWQRSSFCADGACVEVAFLGDRVAIRDSKNKDAEPIVVSSDDFRTFLAWVEATVSVN